MKNKIIVSLAALLFAFTSCSDSYFEVTPESETTVANVYATTDYCADCINGICLLQNNCYPLASTVATYLFSGEASVGTMYGNLMGNDHHFNATYSSWANMTNINSPTSYQSIFAWFYYYKIIANANNLLLYIDSAEGSQSDRDFIKAQALTFRANSYYMLSQIYCHRWIDSHNGKSRGLPLRLDLTEPDDLAASTLAEVYAQVYKDLDDAIELYSGSSAKRDATYKPDITVAYAIYARAALCRQDYTNAAKYAALARADYSLMSVDEYVDGGFNTPTSETIWCLGDCSYNEYYSFYAYMASNTSFYYKLPNSISRELYNQIPTTDCRREMFFGLTDEEWEAGYWSTVGQFEAAGSSTTTSALAQAATRARCVEQFGEKMYSLDGVVQTYTFMYQQFKFQGYDDLGINGEYSLIRASEMMLVEAEADYFLGNDADARNLLIALNKTSGRNPSYTCTKSGADLLTEIKLYRRIELWGEGHDWFDYKRWGDTISRKTFADGGSFRAIYAVDRAPEDNHNWRAIYPYREYNYNNAVTAWETEVTDED